MGRLLLLGAGASVDAGLPSSGDLHAHLIDAGVPRLYGNVASLLYPSGDVDVEGVLQGLEFLYALEQRDSPPAGGVAGFWPGSLQPVQIASLVDQWDTSVAEYLGSRSAGASASPVGRTIESVHDALRPLLWLEPSDENRDRVRYLCSMVEAQAGQSIATLNYDNTVELAGTLTDMRVLACDQESPGGYRYVKPASEEEGVVRLLKLHGSMAWDREADGRVRDFLETDTCTVDPFGVRRPAIIAGAGNKLRADGPWLDLIQAFRSTLGRADTLVTVGYSFRDAHINEMIRRWLDDPPGDGLATKVLRINSLDGAAPPLADHARTKGHVEVDVVHGTAESAIERLVASRPLLET